MSRIADLQRLGYLPVQHLLYDAPPHGGTPWDLSTRTALHAVRIRDRDTARADNPEGLGHYVVGDDDNGDITGFMFWDEVDGQRPLPTVRDVFPTIASTSVGDGGYPTFGRGGPFGARVVRKPWEADARLRELRTDQPDYLPVPVGGLMGLVVQSQEEREQLELWYSTDPRLVAPDRGGKEANGSIVCDVAATGDADTEKRGRLQSHIRVVHADGAYRLGIQGTASLKGGSGFGLIYGSGDGGGRVVNWLARERRGFYHPGHGTADKHKAGTNAEGESEQPAHLWRDALIYKDKVRDGPEENGPDYPENVGSSQRPVRVWLGWDKATELWRWWTRVPIIEPPLVPVRTSEPAVVGGGIGRVGEPGTGGGPGEGAFIHPITGRTIVNRSDGSSGGGVEFGVSDFARSLLLGEPLTATPGLPINPALHEQELAAASLVGTSVRDRDSMPGDGRYGGAGVDSSFPETFAGPQGEFARLTGRRIRGREGELSEYAEARGGPSPFVYHLWGEGQIAVGASGSGSHQYKSEPGQAYGNGNAKAGALYIGPHVLPDGEDDQSALLGELDVLLYTGHRGGSPVRRFGWGTYDRRSDLWTDGGAFSINGAAGSRGMALDFADLSGTPYNGNLALHAVVNGCSTGSNLGLGHAADLAVDEDTADTTLTVGTNDQLQRITVADADPLGGAVAYAWNLTLASAGAVNGSILKLKFILAPSPVGACTVSIIDGPSAATLYSFAAGGTLSRRYVEAHYDGTNWWVVNANIPLA